MVKHNRTIEVDGEEISVVYDDEKNLVYQGRVVDVPDTDSFNYDPSHTNVGMTVSGGWINREKWAKRDDVSMSVFEVNLLRDWLDMLAEEHGEAAVVEVWMRDDWPLVCLKRGAEEPYGIGVAPRRNPVSDEKFIEEYQPDEEESE